VRNVCISAGRWQGQKGLPFKRNLRQGRRENINRGGRKGCPNKQHLSHLENRYLLIVLQQGVVSEMCAWYKYISKSNQFESRLYFQTFFRRVRKKSDYFIRHVCLCAWNNSAHTGRIFMIFDSPLFFSKICQDNSS